MGKRDKGERDRGRENKKEVERQRERLWTGLCMGWGRRE